MAIWVVLSCCFKKKFGPLRYRAWGDNEFSFDTHTHTHTHMRCYYLDYHQFLCLTCFEVSPIRILDYKLTLANCVHPMTQLDTDPTGQLSVFSRNWTL